MRRVSFVWLLSLVFTLSLLGIACAQETTISQSEAVSQGATTADAIQWDDAASYAGQRETVCGPVVDTHYASSSSGEPTFLNLGRRHPDPDRFTVVIWGRNRGNFSTPPESFYMGKTICVTGAIELYQGVPEIEASSPAQIEIK